METTAAELIKRSIEDDDIITVNASEISTHDLRELEHKANVYTRRRGGTLSLCGATDEGTWLIEVVS